MVFSIRSFFRKVPAPSAAATLKPFASLKLALVCDSLTESALSAECQAVALTPANYAKVFKNWRPDLVFVESAWNGHRQSWKYKLASYPDYPLRDNKDIQRLVFAAKEMNIPIVFWNKEDGAHYRRFIATAKLFDYIFTVDSNCIPKYELDVPDIRVIEALPFAVQDSFHHPDVHSDRALGYSCFIGSYSTHVHRRRQAWQDMLFEVFAPRGLSVYDRNSLRKAGQYRYPRLKGLEVHQAVPYQATAKIYKSYRYNLNVNTVEDSPTMYSRRLVEILAVGGVAISTPSLAVSQLFSECCYIVSAKAELLELLAELDGNYKQAMERARWGAEMVAKQHTWANRLMQIQHHIGF